MSLDSLVTFVSLYLLARADACFAYRRLTGNLNTWTRSALQTAGCQEPNTSEIGNIHDKKKESEMTVNGSKLPKQYDIPDSGHNRVRLH